MTPARDTESARTPEKVAGWAKQSRTRTRGRRTKRQDDLRALNARATERQQVWLETGRPNTTQRLTQELVEGYADLREDRATDPAPQSWDEIGLEGNGLERLPYFGRIAAVYRDAS